MGEMETGLSYGLQAFHNHVNKSNQYGKEYTMLRFSRRFSIGDTWIKIWKLLLVLILI